MHLSKTLLLMVEGLLSPRLRSSSASPACQLPRELAQIGLMAAPVPSDLERLSRHEHSAADVVQLQWTTPTAAWDPLVLCSDSARAHAVRGALGSAVR